MTKDDAAVDSTIGIEDTLCRLSYVFCATGEIVGAVVEIKDGDHEWVRLGTVPTGQAIDEILLAVRDALEDGHYDAAVAVIENLGGVA